MLEPHCFPESHLEKHFVLRSEANIECDLREGEDVLMNYSAWKKVAFAQGWHKS